MYEHEVKKELIKRYKYLYKNAPFILLPCIIEEKVEINNNMIVNVFGEVSKIYFESDKKKIKYLKIPFKLTLLFEEFLLSDIKMEDTTLYKITENNKNDKEYLLKVKKGYYLLEKVNENMITNCLNKTLSICDILDKVKNYIENQMYDTETIDVRLFILDEYYKMFNYTNDGIIRKIGIMNKLLLEKDIIYDFSHTNKFIKLLLNMPYNKDNNSIFTEKEKQQVYLAYHNELPWELGNNLKR